MLKFKYKISQNRAPHSVAMPRPAVFCNAQPDGGATPLLLADRCVQRAAVGRGLVSELANAARNAHISRVQNAHLNSTGVAHENLP